MNGEMANLIALTTFGNKFLSNPKLKPPDLLKKSSTFMFTRSIEFLKVTGNSRRRREHLVARNTAGWFAQLRKAGVERISLAAIGYNDSRPYMPDRVAVAFAGCANWAMATQTKKGTTVWILQDEPADDYPPKPRVKRIWNCVIRGYDAKVPLREGPSSYHEAEKALRDALVDINRFGKKRASFRPWSDQFMKALAILDGSKPPSILYWSDLAPKGWLGLPARRLMAAAGQSWVFGGMCSWNDTYIGYEKSPSYKEYKRVSNGLYTSMIDALVFAANHEKDG